MDPPLNLILLGINNNGFNDSNHSNCVKNMAHFNKKPQDNITYYTSIRNTIAGRLFREAVRDFTMLLNCITVNSRLLTLHNLSIYLHTRKYHRVKKEFKIITNIKYIYPDPWTKPIKHWLPADRFIKKIRPQNL